MPEINPSTDHSPLALVVAVNSFCPTNCSPRKPASASARTRTPSTGLPKLSRTVPRSR
jgi:hypothetical protein